MSDDRVDHAPWQLRAPLLLVIGALAGLFVDALLSGSDGSAWNYTDDPLRQALATATIVAGILLAFSLERERWNWSAGFALIGGAVIGGVYYWNGGPAGQGMTKAGGLSPRSWP